MISAQVIADSIYEEHRITTVEVSFHRFILPEVLTHRVFSRNAGSSRALSIPAMIEMVEDDPAIPYEFGIDRPGMVASGRLEGLSRDEAVAEWLQARSDAVRHAKVLNELGVHKQVSNRLLEPFLWQTMVITSTEWQNFFDQRIHNDAQPEHQQLASYIKEALDLSKPTVALDGFWHTPYIDEDEKSTLWFDQRIKVSVARCARVSYLKQGVKNVQKDLELFERLFTADPPHFSPFEHVATPSLEMNTNFRGWRQLRTFNVAELFGGASGTHS